MRISFLTRKVLLFAVLLHFIGVSQILAMESKVESIDSSKCDKLPKIVVKPIDLETNIKMVMQFVSPKFNEVDKSLPFSEYSYKLFPELVGKIHAGMSYEELREVVEPVVCDKLVQNKEIMEKKINNLQEIFDKVNDRLLLALANVHETKWSDSQSEIVCYVGYVPVCPRNIKTKEFYVCCDSSNENILSTAVHEMGHFILYEKWKKIYGPAKDEDLPCPSPRWFLEEIVVDPLLNDARIQEVVPFKQKAYPQFYTYTIEGISIIDHIKNIYEASKNIEEFIKTSFAFIVNNIEEIKKTCE